jgi:osomolarity two-component system sensor histidine kinase TcsA
MTQPYEDQHLDSDEEYSHSIPQPYPHLQPRNHVFTSSDFFRARSARQIASNTNSNGDIDDHTRWGSGRSENRYTQFQKQQSQGQAYSPPEQPSPPIAPPKPVEFDPKFASHGPEAGHKHSGRPIDQVFADLTPIPSLLLDNNLNILQASTTFLQGNSVTASQCYNKNIYDVVSECSLVPAVISWRKTIETAIATRSVYANHTTVGFGVQQSQWCLRAVPIFDKNDLLYLALECLNTPPEKRYGQVGTSSSSEQLDTNDTYRILVETVKDYAIFMLDIHGNVKTWNAGAQFIKGYTPSEIIGRHFSTFYGDDDLRANKPQKELEICMREGKVEDESWRYRKDGSRFWANVIITSVYRGGVHIGFSKVTRDLTERKTAESRLIAAYEESAKLKSAFLANISHEIRTPMHGMLSALTLLMDSALTPEQRELGSIIEESGSVLLQLINDILDYSKLASGNFSVGSDVVHIRDVITSTVRGFKATNKVGVELLTVLDPSLPISAQGDPLRFRQIVQNLLSNACKFTEQGSISVSATVLREDESGYVIRTEVSDTGIGIPEGGEGALFQPFTQFDSSVTKKYKGTGLGLSICKSLAELMGGEIGFRPNFSREDGTEAGSTFWFDVRMEKGKAPQEGRGGGKRGAAGVNGLTNQLENVALSPGSSSRSSGAALAATMDRKKSEARDQMALLRQIAPKKRILLAEDNPINQKVMLMMLKNMGVGHIELAQDGEEAVRLVRMHNLPPPPVDRSSNFGPPSGSIQLGRAPPATAPQESKPPQEYTHVGLDGVSEEKREQEKRNEKVALQERRNFVRAISNSDIHGKDTSVPSQSHPLTPPDEKAAAPIDSHPTTSSPSMDARAQTTFAPVAAPPTIASPATGPPPSGPPSSAPAPLASGPPPSAFGPPQPTASSHPPVSDGTGSRYHQPFDLILMDINMPICDGLAATSTIRRQLGLTEFQLPIVAMTANALKGDVEAYLASGMNDYIPKPVERGRLVGGLVGWLGGE